MQATGTMNSTGPSTSGSWSSPGRLRPRPPDSTVFGYSGTPDTPALNRDVYRWVQSLDLSHSLKNVRRDTANGFIVAEIFSRYFPADIQMHSFANATSSHFKRDNWAQLQRYCAKQGISLPEELVEGSMHGVHGAATALLEHLYEIFTGKKLQRATLPAGGLQGAGAAPVAAALGSSATDTGARTISTQVKAAMNIEFGAVQVQQVGDAMALRRKLAAGGSR